MAITIGTAISLDDIRREFKQIVSYTDELKRRCENIGQWASSVTADQLVAAWTDPQTNQAPTLAEAQEFIDTAMGFSHMIDNALNADTKLGDRVVQIRPIGS